MKVFLYAGIISPHMIPLCDCLYARLGAGNFLYCSTKRMRKERRRLGWKESTREWIVRYDGAPPDEELDSYADEFDVLFAVEFEPKVIDCFRKRGKRILYASERWLKPPFGVVRFIKRSFVRRTRAFASLLQSYSEFVYLPIGPYAAVDALRVVCCSKLDVIGGLRHRKIEFEKCPMGRLHDLERSEDLLKKMRMWGYYVASSKADASLTQNVGRVKQHASRVLWVGRLLSWKRVDTIVRAVVGLADLKNEEGSSPRITLDIYGAGPEEARLKKMGAGYGEVVKFYPPVAIEEVRRLMREHDVYVLSSNGYEGWGAVVNEALEEGMTVLGTYEAGSSATILPAENLFHAGDWRALQEMLLDVSDNNVKRSQNSDCASLWTAEAGAKALCDYIEV